MLALRHATLVATALLAVLLAVAGTGPASARDASPVAPTASASEPVQAAAGTTTFALDQATYLLPRSGSFTAVLTITVDGAISARGVTITEDLPGREILSSSATAGATGQVSCSIVQGWGYVVANLSSTGVGTCTITSTWYLYVPIPPEDVDPIHLMALEVIGTSGYLRASAVIVVADDPSPTPTSTPTDTPTATPTTTPTATPPATTPETPTERPTNTPARIPTNTPPDVPAPYETLTPVAVSGLPNTGAGPSAPAGIPDLLAALLGAPALLLAIACLTRLWKESVQRPRRANQRR
jgi:hypothetical protein